MIRWSALLLTVTMSGCLGAFQGGTIGTPSPQPPPPVAIFDVVACSVPAVNDHCSQPIVGATVTVNGAVQTANSDGYTVWTFLLSTTIDISINAPGYKPLTDHQSSPTPLTKQHNIYTLTVQMPPAPTRDQITHSQASFNSLKINIPDYGVIPWFDPTIASFSPLQRQAIYAAKKANGDTAAMISVSWNYAEPGQPYGSGNRVPPLDLTNDMPQFRARVEELIRNGFIPWIFLAGDAESRPDCTYNDPVGWTYGFDCMMNNILPKVISTLQAPPDLTPYVLILPGFDSVFYGWEPSQDKIPAFATKLHQLCPNCLAGIEFNTGHIPLGHGPADYAPGGLMSGYAVLLGEFDVWPKTGDATWQIVGRLASSYHRPSDQPAGDDPHPPYYLKDSSIVFHCFEWGTYAGIRGNDVSAGYPYYVSIGCPVTEK